MAYGPVVNEGPWKYQVDVTHAPTGKNAVINFQPYDPNTPSTLTEVGADQIFQAFLTAVEALNGVTVLSAMKEAYFSQTVTP